MQFLRQVIDFFLHLDVHLAQILDQYGTWTYGLLFVTVFCETGLVVLPFLPGDSLLFAAGSFAGMGRLDPWLLFLGLVTAAVVGDNLNYFIGRRIGPRAFSGKVRFLRVDYLDRTRAFFARHGGRTIVLARFVPIIRTFTPFVAGVGQMSYPRFLAYDVGGGILWVGLFIWAGYFFGQIAVVQKNFTLVIMAIVGISVLPMVFELLRGKLRANRNAPESSL